jgi:hypothetical protein
MDYRHIYANFHVIVIFRTMVSVLKSYTLDFRKFGQGYGYAIRLPSSHPAKSKVQYF